MMAKVGQFLNDLLNYNKDNMALEVVKAVQEYITLPYFSVEKVISNFFAAAGLCVWVKNILKYYNVFGVIEPKWKSLAAASKQEAILSN